MQDHRHRRLDVDNRQVVAGVHQPVDPQQALAEPAARVEVGEVLFSKPFLDQQCHRQGVTQRQRRGRTGGRHQIHRARLDPYLAIEHHIGGTRERRLRGAGQADDPSTHTLDRLEQAENLSGFAAV